ncbi:MAG: site-specific integrase [Actinomycetota bacterium]|nr:site-specific integrase [Actinomycetota bacterium]
MPVQKKQTRSGIRWYVYTRSDGKQTWHGGYRTKREADAAEAKLRVSKDSGTYRAPEATTVDAFLDGWVTSHKKLRPRTRERYRQLVRDYISPVIGSMRLQTVRPEDAQRVVDKAEETSVHTALKVASVMRAGFTLAVRRGVIPRNPASRDFGVELPEKPEHRIDAPPYPDVLAVVAAAKGQPKYLPLIIAARTGMRRSEVLGLRWSDVDLDAGTLRVRQAATYVGEHVVLTDILKTSHAHRTVTLADDLVRILSAAKTEQADRLGIGPPTRLVVDDGTGQPVHPERLTRFFGRHVRRLGVVLRLHDLRHAYASELLSRGVSPLKVSEQLGHATPAFTMTVYGHVVPRDDDAVRDALALSAEVTV